MPAESLPVETLGVFGIVCALVLALPSPLAFTVASYAALRGRRAALAGIGGGALGLATAMTFAAALVAAFCLLAGPWLDLARQAAMGWLVFFVLWTFATPAAPAAMADNDNLGARTAAGIFCHCYMLAVTRLRYFGVFLALLPQFIADWRDSIDRLSQMQAATLTLAVTSLATQALFCRSTIAFARRMSAGKLRRQARKTHFISGRAVTAGYRRIAA